MASVQDINTELMQRLFSHYSLLIMLCKEIEIKTLWCIKVWDMHFTSE